MSQSKIIAVAGATGAQGGGLVRAIMSDPDGGFTVRAITRDVKSDKAKALADLGAEVVTADVNDADSIRKAFDGAYGAFCVTFFWEHFSPQKELEHATNMAKAAKEAGLNHVVWSTLEDTRRWVPLDDDRMPTLMENYKVPHFDAKGEADHVFSDLGVPTTFLLTSFFWENLIFFGMGPKKGEDGKFALTLPMGDKKLPGIGVEDIGRCAYGILKNPDEFVGKTVGIAGEHMTGQEMADSLAKALGEEVGYNEITPEMYRSFDFPGAEDLGNMFQFKRDFQEAFCGPRNINVTRKLNPSLQSFDQWLEKNKSRIPLD